jgi:hypothetical protein
MPNALTHMVLMMGAATILQCEHWPRLHLSYGTGRSSTTALHMGLESDQTSSREALRKYNHLMHAFTLNISCLTPAAQYHSSTMHDGLGVAGTCMTGKADSITLASTCISSWCAIDRDGRCHRHHAAVDTSDCNTVCSHTCAIAVQCTAGCSVHSTRNAHIVVHCGSQVTTYCSTGGNAYKMCCPWRPQLRINIMTLL